MIFIIVFGRILVAWKGTRQRTRTFSPDSSRSIPRVEEGCTEEMREWRKLLSLCIITADPQRDEAPYQEAQTSRSRRHD